MSPMPLIRASEVKRESISVIEMMTAENGCHKAKKWILLTPQRFILLIRHILFSIVSLKLYDLMRRLVQHKT